MFRPDFSDLLIFAVYLVPGAILATLVGICGVVLVVSVLLAGKRAALYRWRGVCATAAVFLLHLFLLDVFAAQLLSGTGLDWYFDADIFVWPLARLMIELVISAIVVRLLRVSDRVG